MISVIVGKPVLGRLMSLSWCTHVAPGLSSNACKSLLRRILGAVQHSILKDNKGLVMWHGLLYHSHLTAVRRSLQTGGDRNHDVPDTSVLGLGDGDSSVTASEGTREAGQEQQG